MTNSPTNLYTPHNENELKNILKENRPTLINFYADWAEPCAQINDVVSELASTYQKMKFVMANADELEDSVDSYKVESVPTCVIVKNGKIVETIEGANPALLSKMVQQVYQQIDFDVKEQSLESRIHSLVNSSPVMIFIKGTPSSPRCGFTRQLIALLDEKKVNYGFFDILGDNDIREGLKTFSDWPTFPQVYIKGEFIGGLDIMKEMESNGQLESILPKQETLNEMLEKLIKKAPVMAFIKGTPSQPRCGFTRQLVDMFKEEEIDFDYFDILQDDQVRQGLKTYSDWPTYPQVYFRGELIGGLDILKEMKANGELKQSLGQ